MSVECVDIENLIMVRNDACRRISHLNLNFLHLCTGRSFWIRTINGLILSTLRLVVSDYCLSKGRLHNSISGPNPEGVPCVIEGTFESMECVPSSGMTSESVLIICGYMSSTLELLQIGVRTGMDFN